MNLDILVGSAQPVGPLIFLNRDLTAHQRQMLSASTAVTTTTFLQQQPALLKTAVCLVKHWVRGVHGSDWDDEGLRNRCVRHKYWKAVNGQSQGLSGPSHAKVC